MHSVAERINGWIAAVFCRKEISGAPVSPFGTGPTDTFNRSDSPASGAASIVRFPNPARYYLIQRVGGIPNARDHRGRSKSCSSVTRVLQVPHVELSSAPP